MPRGSNLTPEFNRRVGLLGGRPKGVLNKKTIEKIKTKEAMEAIIREKAGLIIEDLFKGSSQLKTEASKELLERGFGKVPQGVNLQAVTFSLKDLADYRKSLAENPQDVLQVPNKTIENPEEKKPT